MKKRHRLMLPLIIIAFLILPAAAAGADLTIVCENEGQCQGEPDGALFSVSNAVPGEEFAREIEIKNERGKSCDLTLGAERTGEADILSGWLVVRVSDSDSSYFSGSFDDFLGAAPVDIGTVGGGENKTVSWKISFDKEAGNEYQAKRVDFDAAVYISCEDADDPGDLPAGMILGAATGAGGVPRILGVSAKAALERFPAAGAERLGWGLLTMSVLAAALMGYWRRRGKQQV
jgi:hypothetical protein